MEVPGIPMDRPGGSEEVPQSGARRGTRGPKHVSAKASDRIDHEVQPLVAAHGAPAVRDIGHRAARGAGEALALGHPTKRKTLLTPKIRDGMGRERVASEWVCGL